MLGSQISNRDNNNTTELVCKGNINLAMKTQEGTHNLRQINAKDSPDHESGRLVKQQFGYNLNNRESQKPHSLPDVLPDVLASSLHQSKDLNKLNQNNSAFTATLPNFKSSNTPTESYSKYSNNYCSSTTSCIPASPHKDAEKLAKQSSSNRATFGLPPISNTKTSSPFSTHSLSNQANIHTLSYVGFSSQTSKFTNSANTIPLGFERSSASILTASDPKTVSTKIPTSSAVSKANYNLISSSPPAATASPVPSFTTITISSFQTPPATPIMTSHNSEIPSYKEGRAFSGRTESGPKKLQVEGKGVRRVTWGDSVDLLHFEPITVEKPDPSGVPASPLSLPRSPVSVRAPSIFSFLRSDSPTKTKSPLCSPTPKNSNIQVGKGGKYRSLSSGSVDLTSKHQEICKQKTSDNKIFDHRTRDLTTTRQERTQSVESGIFQHCPSAPLSLPPDFSGGYKVRYSSTPYSTLMSSRSTQGETKTITLISPLFQQACQSVYNPHPSLQGEPLAGMNLPTSRPPLLPTSPHQPLTLPFQNKTVMQESLSCGVSEIDQINNNQSKNSSQDHQNGQIFLVDNKVHMNSQPLRGDKAHNSFSAYVTETLIYSIKSKVDTAAAATKNNALKSLQHTENTSVSVEKQLHTVQSNAVEGKSHSRSDESCSGSSSTETNSRDEEGCNQRIKECVLSKSSNEQSPKRSRFPLRKSISTQNSSLSRSDSDRTNKTNNKMDQVLNRLRQTFSNRRSDDDLFPWKWKRASQATGSGSNDISSVSDVTVESTKTLEECEEKRGMALKDKETACTERWTQNRCTVIPPPVAGEQFFIGSDKSAPETSKDEQNVCTENESENKTQVHLTGHSPTMYQSDFSKESRTDCKPRNQFLLYRDPSPGRSANPSGDYPTRLRSTSSPRSPFLSLSPLSPFSLPDVTDDSVFYSPKLQHRREFTSPCEPEERICLGASRRNHVSTDPRSAGLGQDKEHLASSYADLKYGIEPGRSVSVSSVLSSRPSGPGRISTGSKFMSVGDLSESSLTCGGTSKNLDQWLFTPDWATDCDSQHADSCSGKMRSRSLPRSLTRRLANWSSGVSISQPVITTASKPACLWSPNMKNCHFAWDTGPPTPPPTPPLSPSSRLMFKCLSSSMVPSSPGAQQPVDSQFSRGHLPSRSYVASLSTFEESSDSSSDTTTDDEYYLETGEDEKETEL
nr:uncharacterized protein LOC109965945 isoform X2 [Monopterus albus]